MAEQISRCHCLTVSMCLDHLFEYFADSAQETKKYCGHCYYCGRVDRMLAHFRINVSLATGIKSFFFFQSPIYRVAIDQLQLHYTHLILLFDCYSDSERTQCFCYTK